MSETETQDWFLKRRGYYYRPNAAGYTGSTQEAGRYSEAEARAHCESADGVSMEPAPPMSNQTREPVEGGELRIVALDASDAIAWLEATADACAPSANERQSDYRAIATTIATLTADKQRLEARVAELEAVGTMLLDRWNAYLRSDRNMQDAYYTLAKKYEPWNALTRTLQET